jgi:MoaA/NifB/PqqE/SkfB family radical SAM enzyme
MLCREKKRRGLEKPHINLQFVVMAQNEHQIPDIIELGRKLGVDSLSLKSMSLGSSVKTEEEKLELARKWLPSNDRHRRYYISNGRVYLKEVPETCPWYRRGVIYWNGDVGICCYDFNGLNVFGNVLEEGGLTKIYKSRRWSEVQKKVMFKQFELCRRCNLSVFKGEPTYHYEDHR